MKVLMFAVFDVKAGAFASPFFKPAIGLAVRDFQDAARDEGSVLSRHPEDFQLFHIGEFDDNTGIVQAVAPAVMLGSAAEVRSDGKSKTIREVKNAS